MEIYIEYALMENFLYDGVLLWLAYRAAKVKTRAWKLCLSAGIGAVFAVVYPLLALPRWAGILCKIALGALLCLLPFPTLRARGQMKRYLFTVALFFTLSFGFGGALLGVYGQLSSGKKIPSLWVWIGFTLLTAGGMYLIKTLYAKRSIHSACYDCTLYVKQRNISALGFYDSGNLATYKDAPICFISPALLYDLLGDEIWEGERQVCDETVISTLSGDKKVRLYSGKIEVKAGKEHVCAKAYFAPNKNMIGREYAVLIHARILEGRAEHNAID